MSDQSKHIIWVLTEPVDFRDSDAWDEVEFIGKRVINTIGNPSLEHEVVSPRLLLEELANQIKGEKFSSVVNLASAEFTPFFKRLFPHTPVVQFPISRVRDAVAVETLGYQVRVTEDKLASLRTVDFSAPLLFDDVGHTGGTQRMAMDMLAIEPKAATHAFLLANEGVYKGNPALVPYLREIGARAFYAKTFSSPEDKIWHMEDLHGGKRRPWEEQVNPLLGEQEKIRPHLRGSVHEADGDLMHLQMIARRGKEG